ncbi:ABC-three component system middle component 1, partial [Bacillus cereus]
MSKLNEIFKLKGDGYFLNVQLMYLDYLYVSHQGIYGLKTFKNVEELKKDWEYVQLEFATKIQRKLSGGVSDLRWDMYLVFYIEDEISINTRKIIENDKTFFRKLIITPNEIIENKLLLTLEIE